MADAEDAEHDVKAMMLAKYGPLLSGKELVNALGYPTQTAFWQARRVGRVEVRTFRISGRKGTFALTTEVAAWLSNVSGRTLS